MDVVLRQSLYRMMALYVKVDAMDAMHMMLQILENEMPKEKRDMWMDLWHQQLETRWRVDAAEALWEKLWNDPILQQLDLVLGPRPTQFPSFVIKVDGAKSFSVSCAIGSGDDAKNPDYESMGARPEYDDGNGDVGIQRHGSVFSNSYDKTIHEESYNEMISRLRMSERVWRGDKSRQGPTIPEKDEEDAAEAEFAEESKAQAGPLLRVSELSPLLRQVFETPAAEVKESENPWAAKLQGVKKMSEAASIVRQAFGAATPQDEVDRINKDGGHIPWKVAKKRGKSGK
jgi:hypothetical protein